MERDDALLLPDVNAKPQPSREQRPTLMPTEVQAGGRSAGDKTTDQPVNATAASADKGSEM